MTHDPVNRPKHYVLHDGTEVIDHLASLLTPDQFRGYLKGTALAYIIRADDKNGSEDYAKAEWYCRRLSQVTNG
jgi:hypothetical protein